MNYYYYNGQNRQGPVDAKSIKALVSSGIITPETIIENEAGKKCQASKVNGLVFNVQVPETATPPSPFVSSVPSEQTTFIPPEVTPQKTKRPTSKIAKILAIVIIALFVVGGTIAFVDSQMRKARSAKIDNNIKKAEAARAEGTKESAISTAEIMAKSVINDTITFHADSAEIVQRSGKIAKWEVNGTIKNKDNTAMNKVKITMKYDPDYLLNWRPCDFYIDGKLLLSESNWPQQ